MMKRTLGSSLAQLVVILPFVAGIVTIGSAQTKLNFSGYFTMEAEKGWDHPVLRPGEVIEREQGPMALAIYSFNLVMQTSITDRLRFYGNLTVPEGEIGLNAANLWGEYSVSRYLNIRFGKMYRKFGLYNEILDAVPTYMGIDPPEHFSDNHLILSRTTNAMVYGNLGTPELELNYSVSADNSTGIGDSFEKSLPVGWDFNVKFDEASYTVGFSGFHTFGDMHANVELGDGFSDNGVFPWMAKDKFSVFTGYVEANVGDLTLQAEYVTSPHEAVRDVQKAITVVNEALLNATQMARFLINPAGPVDAGNIRTKADYTTSSYYVRASYSFNTSIGEIAPYGWVDYYSTPENINEELLGGDGEAGDTDTGVMGSYTFGVVYRPDPLIALKLENENHYMKFEKFGNLYSPEVRFVASFIFGQ